MVYMEDIYDWESWLHSHLKELFYHTEPHAFAIAYENNPDKFKCCGCSGGNSFPNMYPYSGEIQVSTAFSYSLRLVFELLFDKHKIGPSSLCQAFHNRTANWNSDPNTKLPIVLLKSIPECELQICQYQWESKRTELMTSFQEYKSILVSRYNDLPDFDFNCISSGILVDVIPTSGVENGMIGREIMFSELSPLISGARPLFMQG